LNYLVPPGGGAAKNVIPDLSRKIRPSDFHFLPRFCQARAAENAARF